MRKVYIKNVYLRGRFLLIFIEVFGINFFYLEFENLMDFSIEMFFFKEDFI